MLPGVETVGPGVWGVSTGGRPAPSIDASSNIHRNKQHTREHAVGFNVQNACG